MPTFRRGDVTREADLIEEVARLDGLEKLPATLPSRHGASGRLTAVQRMRRAAADALAAQGLHEIVGWSFVAPDLAQRLRLPRPPCAGTREPDVDRAVAAAYDAAGLDARHRPSQPLARRGHAAPVRGRRRCTCRPARASSRPSRITSERCCSAGARRPPGAIRTRAAPTSSRPRACSAACWAACGPGGPWSPATEPFLHPGRAARILVDGEPAGWLGEIHPLVAAEWDIEDTVGRVRARSRRGAAARDAAVLRRDQLPGGARGSCGGRGRRRRRRRRARGRAPRRRAAARARRACSTSTATLNASAQATCRWR